MNTWSTIWDHNPYFNVPEGRKDDVLGAETALWSEMNTEFNIGTKLFPRSAALAFRYWGKDEALTKTQSMERLIRFEWRLKRAGLATQPVTLRYCEKYLHHCFGD